jgi:hypothetical protein
MSTEKCMAFCLWYDQPGMAALPLDAGTQRVLRDGFMVLFERGNLLSQHAKPAS